MESKENETKQKPQILSLVFFEWHLIIIKISDLANWLLNLFYGLIAFHEITAHITNNWNDTLCFDIYFLTSQFHNQNHCTRFSCEILWFRCFCCIWYDICLSKCQRHLSMKQIFVNILRSKLWIHWLMRKCLAGLTGYVSFWLWHKNIRWHIHVHERWILKLWLWLNWRSMNSARARWSIHYSLIRLLDVIIGVLLLWFHGILWHWNVHNGSFIWMNWVPLGRVSQCLFESLIVVRIPNGCFGVLKKMTQKFETKLISNQLF